jgi:hypothetical protein
MSINTNINWEVKTSGTRNSGSAFNPSNAQAGLNYAYGDDYEIFTITDLELSNSSAPDILVYVLNASTGSLPSGSYDLGVQYLILDGNNNIIVTSPYTDDTISITLNDSLLVTSPSVPYPFTHYRVFLKPTVGSNAYVQSDANNRNIFPNGVNANISSYASTAYIVVPNDGTALTLNSTARPFISDDIGNFICIESNHFGFRSLDASEVSPSEWITMGETSNEPWAAWIDILETRTLKQMSLVMWAQGSPSGDIFFELRSDNAGVPSNTVLTVGGFAAGSLTSSPAWYDLSINVVCSPGRYWFVFYPDVTIDIANYIKVGRKSGVNYINDEHLYSYDTLSTTWTSVDDGIAVALDTSWNSTDIWGDANATDYVRNYGNLRLEILGVDALGRAVVHTQEYLANIDAVNGIGFLGGADSNFIRVFESADIPSLKGNIYLQSGTYTLNEPLILQNVSILGYDITHEDNADKPVIEVNVATGSGLYALDGGDGLIKIDADNIKLENLEIDGNSYCEKIIYIEECNALIQNCHIHHGTKVGIGISAGSNKNIYIKNTHINNISGSYGAIYNNTDGNIFVDTSSIIDSTGCGIYNKNAAIKINNFIADNISGTGLSAGHGLYLVNPSNVDITFSTFNECNHGVHIQGTSVVKIYNSLFTNCYSGIGISATSPSSIHNTLERNAFYNNTAYIISTTYSYSKNEIILSSNPYVTSTLIPNGNATGGARLVGTAAPDKFIILDFSQKLDVGAVQSFGNTPIPRRAPTVSLF